MSFWEAIVLNFGILNLVPGGNLLPWSATERSKLSMLILREGENAERREEGENMKKLILLGQSILVASWLVLSCGSTEKALVAPASSPASNVESVARGGLLYDMWWTVVPGASEPKSDHPLWSLQTTNKRSGSVSWRCKECHGWDYRGKEGAYGSGSRYTGFMGVWDAAQNKSAEQLATILRGSSSRPPPPS